MRWSDVKTRLTRLERSVPPPDGGGGAIRRLLDAALAHAAGEPYERTIPLPGGGVIDVAELLRRAEEQMNVGRSGAGWRTSAAAGGSPHAPPVP